MIRVVRALDRNAVYRGEVLLFRGLKNMKLICERFEAHVSQTVGEEIATLPHSLMPEAARVTLCDAFEKDAEVLSYSRCFFGLLVS